LLFSVHSSVSMPIDRFSYYVNDELGEMWGVAADSTSFEVKEIELDQGPHEITFVYEYNPIQLEANFPQEPNERIGAVFLDDFYFLPS